MLLFFFFFTDEGRVYKVVQWYNDEGVPGSALLDIFDIMPGLPITAMEISKKVSSRRHYFNPDFSPNSDITHDVYVCIRVFNRDRSIFLPLDAFARNT